MKKFLCLVLPLLIITGWLAACQPGWQIAITEPSGEIGYIDRETVAFYIKMSVEPVESVPLGQLLYHHGISLIDQIQFSDKDGEITVLAWDAIAETATIDTSGRIAIDENEYYPRSLSVIPSRLSQSDLSSIMDIPVTVAAALGLPDMKDAIGRNLLTSEGPYDHAVMILLDGTQLDTLIALIEADRLPFLKGLTNLTTGLTVYPPITTSASAAVLTGASPLSSQVFGYGYRTTDLPTLFDLAASAGKKVIAIEGSSLSFNLRNAETILSGDRDGDGYSDDNVFKNSMDVIESDMPDLLYIHFHEIDDMGHTFGPDSAEYTEAIIRVDQYLKKILGALPHNTFIVIFADHGMHTTPEGGNHGTLTADDLLIPIIIQE